MMNEEPEIDVRKYIAYWRDGALECWKDYENSIKGNRISFAMFAVHLSVEKALKAHVVKKTKDHPPMIHNLISLANIAGLKVSEQRLQIFSELNPLNIEARYPGIIRNPISKREALVIAKRAKAVLEWLIEEL